MDENWGRNKEGDMEEVRDIEKDSPVNAGDHVDWDGDMDDMHTNCRRAARQQGTGWMGPWAEVGGRGV